MVMVHNIMFHLGGHLRGMYMRCLMFSNVHRGQRFRSAKYAIIDSSKYITLQKKHKKPHKTSKLLLSTLQRT